MQTSISFPQTVSTNNIRRTPLDFAAIFLMLIILSSLICIVSWQFWHVNRIFSGVTVASIPVGGMTRVAAFNHLSQATHTIALPPIQLRHQDRQWPITGQFITRADMAAAVNEAYRIGRDGPLSERLRLQLQALLNSYEIMPSLIFDRGQLRQAIGQVAAHVHRPARSESTVNNVVMPSQTGIIVDVEATLQTVLAELRERAEQKEPISISLITREFGSQVHADETKTGADTTSEHSQTVENRQSEGSLPAFLQSPFLLQNQRYELEMALDPYLLSEILFSFQPLRLDIERATAALALWAEQIDRSPRDARLQFNPNSGTVSILQTSEPGRRINVEATLVSLQDALQNNQSRAQLVVDEVAPAVDMNRIPEMGIRELVASGTSRFAGSSTARVHNIQVATAQFEGVVIPPGGIFSFNKIVEDVSSANGFDESLIIFGNETAVGVGGGVCQVSTTVFRAAYKAGMPIVERYNHGYVVSWYGEPGLDATIYTPTVDFRFRNDTAAHLLIDPHLDLINGTITFSFYGTKPDREVIIRDKVISDTEEPEEPLYQEDPTLAAGEIKQVEWENEGMTVEIERTIIEAGQTRSDTLTSVYRPWQAVYRYGPGTKLPDAALVEDEIRIDLNEEPSQ
ncbi:VanW family protein [Chloroflexi bacterium TSY]|nr:VanW family protein [Chloroflexi bacterium TSY]